MTDMPNEDPRCGTSVALPAAAISAAKEAMRTVTPPPGVSKSAWLTEHGDFALIAGAIAAAANYIHEESYLEGWDNAKLYYEPEQ